jgi:hypothetical protein
MPETSSTMPETSAGRPGHEPPVVVVGNAITKGPVRIELEELGEGLMDEYDQSDPNDVELLRFTCALAYPSTDERSSGQPAGSYVDIESFGSFCTNLPASLNDTERRSALEVLMDRLYEPLVGHLERDDFAHKRPAEEASWIDPTWLATPQR